MTTTLSQSIDLGQGVTMDVYRIPIDSVILGIAHDIFDHLHSCVDGSMKLIQVECNGNKTFCESALDLAELCTGLGIQEAQLIEATMEISRFKYKKLIIKSENIQTLDASTR